MADDDLTATKTLLDRLGLIYEEEPYEDGILLILRAHASERQTGYGRFFTDLSFRQDGSFEMLGIWE